MAWTNTQKQIAATACRMAGLGEDARYNILRQFPHAMHQGRITSTSPRLSNADFEQFMAIVEHWGKGQVPGWRAGYWNAKAGDALARMRHRARALALELEAKGHLQPNGVGLRGWLGRVAEGKSDLVQLDYRELYNLIEGLKAYARRRGVNPIQESVPC